MDYFDYSREFVKEWYERAEKEEGTKYITKFFCYFIAFNHVYNTYAYQKENDKVNREEGLTYSGERSMIKGLLNYLIRESGYENFRDFSPYSLLDENAEILKHVKTNRTDEKSDLFQRNLDRGMVTQLFMEIYSVRCNLFHGAKSMVKYRDSRLVKDSNLILRDFLKRLV